jgi:hypothetical protein
MQAAAATSPAVRSAEWSALGLRLWSAAPRSGAPAPRSNLVSTSIFRFRAAYKDSAKTYARGLTLLAAAVSSHLPDFTLRVYADHSVDPRAVRECARRASDPALAAQLEEVARSWEACFSALAACACPVEVVWYRCDAFLASGTAADGIVHDHQDLFGTTLRFLPLFNTSDVLPSWCGSPPDGSVVFVSDVDFYDWNDEHYTLHLVRWYAARVAAAAAAGARAGATAADGLPHLVTVSAAGTRGLRHYPTIGMPRFIASCVATRTRFPGGWLADFFRDAHGSAAAWAAAGAGRSSQACLACGLGHEPAAPCAGSTLLARFAEGAHEAASHHGGGAAISAAKRRITEQRYWPYGCDEFLLTNVLKPRALAAATVQQWLFLIVPTFDLSMSVALAAALKAVTAAVARTVAQQAAGLAGTTVPPLHASAVLVLTHAVAVARGAAAAAGAEKEFARCLAPEDGSGPADAPHWVPPTDGTTGLALLQRLLASLPQWRSAWPAAVRKAVGLWTGRFGGRFLAVQPGAPARAAAGLRTMYSALLDAYAAAAFAHSADDMQQAVDDVQLAADVAPGLVGALAYSVGAGRVVPPSAQRAGAVAQCADLMASLVGHNAACGVAVAAVPISSSANASCWYVPAPPGPTPPTPETERAHLPVTNAASGGPGTNSTAFTQSVTVEQPRKRARPEDWECAADAGEGEGGADSRSAAAGGSGAGAQPAPHSGSMFPTAAEPALIAASLVPAQAAAPLPNPCDATKAPLPAGWTRHVSRSSGATYYFHAATGASRYDPPL